MLRQTSVKRRSTINLVLGNISAENASELEFIEDSDDSVKDANYVNECLSSTESSSSCSTCSSDYKTRETRYDAENKKDAS
nr:unnamed protein product [Callosobruchus analis]